MTGVILTIDPATCCGWALGALGTRPTWGARDFGKRKSNGEVISTFRHWLNAMCFREKPGTICFESPYIATAGPRRGPGGPPPQNMDVLLRLCGLVGAIEATAFELHIRCLKCSTQEFTKYFTGRGRWPGGRVEKKQQTIAACERYGWLGVSDDEADALSLWAFAESIFAPTAASRRKSAAGLELPLHDIIPQKAEPSRGPTPTAPDDSTGESTRCQTRMII